MAGVPFDALRGLATSESIACARTLRAQMSERDQAKAEVESFFASRQQLLSPKAYHALRVAVRTNRPPETVAEDLPAFFVRYANAARDVESSEARLDRILAGEVDQARAALIESSRLFLKRYLVFAAPGVRDFLSKQLEDYPADLKTLPPRNNAARKVEGSLLLYLQRVAAKNDTFSEFGPAGWGRADQDDTPLSIDPQQGVAAREIFLERWTAHAVAALINGDADVFAELCPRLNPNGRIVEQTFIAADTGEKKTSEQKGKSHH